MYTGRWGGDIQVSIAGSSTGTRSYVRPHFCSPLHCTCAPPLSMLYIKCEIGWRAGQGPKAREEYGERYGQYKGLKLAVSRNPTAAAFVSRICLTSHCTRFETRCCLCSETHSHL